MAAEASQPKQAALAMAAESAEAVKRMAQAEAATASIEADAAALKEEKAQQEAEEAAKKCALAGFSDTQRARKREGRLVSALLPTLFD